MKVRVLPRSRGSPAAPTLAGVVAGAAESALPTAMLLAAVQANADDQLLAVRAGILHDHLPDAQQAPPYTRPSARRLPPRNRTPKHSPESYSGRRALNSGRGQDDPRKVQETQKCPQHWHLGYGYRRLRTGFPAACACSAQTNGGSSSTSAGQSPLQSPVNSPRRQRAQRLRPLRSRPSQNGSFRVHTQPDATGEIA
jgi:hypothetical protein